jgi:molybdenum cofactor cytidylyltransferase
VASVAVILLAAGESTRMGRQKALLPWRCMTLIEYQLAQLAAVDAIAEIIVVTGHEASAIAALAAQAPRTRVVHNPAYRTGKVSSIKAGVAAISPHADAVLLLAVDQPRPAGVLATLVQHHVAAHAAITVPAYEGRRGHPVIFDRGLVPELLEISEETQGVRDVMRRHAAEVGEVAMPDAVVRLDLNTPSDVEDEDARPR